jgi:hypothetical protein
MANCWTSTEIINETKDLGSYILRAYPRSCGWLTIPVGIPLCELKLLE